MTALPTTVRTLDRSTAGGLLALVGLAIVYLIALRTDAAWPVFWISGVAFGAICQRSRFCFVAGFRDLFLMRQGRMLRGIIAGLAVATAGFAMIMATVVPNPGSGVLPSDAHILPLGIATVLGGLLFGFGMVLSGGCVSGSLYRMGEGYIGSWIAIGGVLLGLYAMARTWNWWWDNQISSDRISWLPTDLSYTGAIVITFAAARRGLRRRLLVGAASAARPPHVHDPDLERRGGNPRGREHPRFAGAEGLPHRVDAAERRHRAGGGQHPDLHPLPPARRRRRAVALVHGLRGQHRRGGRRAEGHQRHPRLRPALRRGHVVQRRLHAQRRDHRRGVHGGAAGEGVPAARAARPAPLRAVARRRRG